MFWTEYVRRLKRIIALWECCWHALFSKAYASLLTLWFDHIHQRKSILRSHNQMVTWISKECRNSSHNIRSALLPVLYTGMHAAIQRLMGAFMGSFLTSTRWWGNKCYHCSQRVHGTASNFTAISFMAITKLSSTMLKWCYGSQINYMRNLKQAVSLLL